MDFFYYLNSPKNYYHTIKPHLIITKKIEAQITLHLYYLYENYKVTQNYLTTTLPTEVAVRTT